ncbi:MAG: hypothetical protein IKO47_10995 [Ruminococcus sp.]|nr:hypothetical protein [Ruminococcus sp.]
MANSKKPANGKRPAAPPPKEKVVVKKRGGCLVAIIILILLALLAFLLGLHFGWWGKGDGDGDGDGDSKNSSSTSEAADKSSQKDIYVTVSGAKYVLDGETLEIEALVNKIADESNNGKVLVHLTDDNATDSAMNELKEALDNSAKSHTNINYVEEAPAEDSSAA